MEFLSNAVTELDYITKDQQLHFMSSFTIKQLSVLQKAFGGVSYARRQTWR